MRQPPASCFRVHRTNTPSPASGLVGVVIFGMALLLIPAGAHADPVTPTYTAADCVACHGAEPRGAADPVDFTSTPVVRANVCKKCHWEPSGAHPFHNQTWNCVSCHPEMGATNLSAVPRYYSSAYGAYFNSVGSALADTETLHIVHANPRWPAALAKNGRQCASCHASASCVACHEGSIDPTHEDHTWDVTLGGYRPGTGPGSTRFGSGTSPGNEDEDSVVPALSCSNATCHDITSGGSQPVLVEDTNAAVKYSVTPGWTRSSTTGYSGNTYRISNAAGARAELRFTGQRVQLVSDMGTYRGRVRVSIDSVEVTTVDLYGATVTKQVPVFTSATLASGEHTITVEVTGQRNTASRAAYVVLDAFRVYPKVGTTRTPCSTCHDAPHAAVHTNTWTACGGTGCHNEPDLVAVHVPVGCVCHRSSDPKVTAAVVARNRDCIACHNPMLTHGAVHEASPDYAAPVGFPTYNGFTGQPEIVNAYVIKCLSCHRTNLLASHGSDYTNCSMCHLAGGPRSSFTAWNKTCQTGVCHPGSEAPHPVPDRAHYHEKMGAGVQPEGMCASCHGNPEGWQCGAPFGCHTSVVPPVTSVDFRPPVTLLSQIASEPITWRLTATDIGDGVTGTYYSFDGAPFAVYGATESAAGITNLADTHEPYAHTLRYYSIDAAGNTEAIQTKDYNVIDNTPPVISFNGVSLGSGTFAARSLVMSVSDPKVNGYSTGVAYVYTEVRTFKTTWGWFPFQAFYQPMASFTYPLDATWDTTRAIAPVEAYAIAKSSPGFWPTYGDFGGGSGRFEMQYYARDYTGNETPLTYAYIWIDNGAPTTTSASAGTYRWRLNATDLYVAGVASTYYSFDGAPFELYTAADASVGIANTQPGGEGPGAHALRFYSVDRLGNTETTKTLDYTIP